MWLFDTLVALHIVTGTVGLVAMWVPIVGRKGGAVHRRWGTVFVRALSATGLLAVGISLVTLTWPLQTHTFWDDAPLIRGLFGWMMLYLATLTLMLCRYGVLCIRHRREHRRLREPLNLALQLATFITAVNCAWHGWQLGQPLMMGIAVIGVASAVLNLHYMYRAAPPANEWLIQHTRGVVGAGISVYTAFFAFGAVNLLPAIALNPILWATPCTLGIALLLYHQIRISRARRGATATAGPAGGSPAMRATPAPAAAARRR